MKNQKQKLEKLTVMYDAISNPVRVVPAHPASSFLHHIYLLLVLLLLLPASLHAVPAKPVISRQPAGATYSENATARFYVNAHSTDGGYLEYQWYRSQPFSAPVSPSGVYTSAETATIKAGAVALPGLAATLITITPAVAGTEYYYYWAVITNNREGDSDFIESAFALAKIVDRTLHTELMQGDFEDLGVGQVSIGSYWNTTHDAATPDSTSGFTGSGGYKKILEIYTRTSYGLTNNNTYMCELSPQAACSNYQDIATVPGKIYEWSLDHAARVTSITTSPQVMAVIIGPAINTVSDYADFGITNRWIDDAAAPPDYVYPYGKNYTTYFYDIVNKLAQDLGTTVVSLRTTPAGGAPYTAVYGSNTYYIYISSDTQDPYFVHRSGVYTVPAGQGTTVFGFVPITIDNAVGNVIDNVVFASGSPLAPAPTITYDNTVTLSAPAQAGYAYGLAEVRGSSVSLVPGATAYYDPDGAGASPETVISKTAGLGIDGWYSTDGANTPFAGGGVITFKNLTPGKTYRIVGIPTLAVNSGLHVNETPEYVLDEGYYSDVQTAPAYEGDASAIWNIDVDTYMDGGVPKARISVKNARADVEYALLADDGSMTHIPLTSAPADAGTDWKPGVSGFATFDNLTLDTYYHLVARPYGYEEVTYADAAYDIDGTTPKYITVKTPGAVADIDAADVSRSPDCLSVELQNSRTGYTYAVVDPATGVIIGSTQAGNGSTLNFPVPDASKTYQIVNKSGDVNWLRGVRIYGCPDNFFIDYRNETVKSSHDAGGNIPTDVEYHIRSNNAGNTWIVGDPNTRTAGIGTQPVDLSTKILAGNTVGILDSITSLNAGATLFYRVKPDAAYTGQLVSPVRELIIPPRPPAPDAPADYLFDYVNEEIDVVADSLHFAQINASQWTGVLNGAAWTFAAAGWGEGVSERPFRVRIPATNTSFASSIRTDTVPARPAAPDLNLKGNGDISKVVITDMIDGTGYQYHTSGVSAWTSYTPTGTTESDSINFTPTDTCFVRFAATADAPASFTAVLTVTPLSIQPVYFADYAYGATPVSQAVVIKNSLGATVDVTSVALEGTNSEHYHFAVEPQPGAGMQVPANGVNTNWVLIPNNNLDAGTYNTRLKMTYTHNNITYTAYADVYLTVEKATWDMSGIHGAFDVSQTKAQRLVLDITGAPAGAVLSYYYGSTPVPGNPTSTVDAGGETGYTFTAANGLQPSTTYPVSVIAPEDNNHYASPLTPLATGYTAYATPVFDDVIVIDYINERLTFVSGYSSADYTLRCASCAGNPAIANPYSLYSILEDEDNQNMVFSIMHNAGVSPPYPASDTAFSNTVPGRPAAPPVYFNTATPASSVSTGDGAIGIMGLFEYRIHGTSSWSSASTTAANLLVGDYDVRYPATATSFASRQALVTVSTIVTQPLSVGVVKCCIHDTLFVAIPPTVNTVDYQWFENTLNSNVGGSPVAGATESRFPVPVGLDVGTYYYYCEISITGSAVLVSDAATVTVGDLSKRLTSVSPSATCVGGSIHLTFAGASPHEVRHTVDDGNGTGEYFFTVAGSDTTIVANTAGVHTFDYMLDGYACQCAGNGLPVTVHQQMSVDYSDIRVSICPDAGATVNLSKYVDSLWVTHIQWTSLSGVPISSPEGLISTNSLSSSRAHTFTYTVDNVCTSDVITRKFYLEVLKNGMHRRLKDTIVVCYLQAEAVQINQIFGIEAGGSWEYQSSAPHDIDSYVTLSTSAIYGGALVMDGKGIYEDTGIPLSYFHGVAAKTVDFIYKTKSDGCLHGKEYKITIVLTEDMF